MSLSAEDECADSVGTEDADGVGSNCWRGGCASAGLTKEVWRGVVTPSLAS